MSNDERIGRRSFVQALGAAGARLEIDVVPGIALHPFRAPAAQELSIDRLVAWVVRMRENIAGEP